MLIPTYEGVRALARHTLASRASAATVLQRAGYYPTEAAIALLRQEWRLLREAPC